MKPEVQVAPPSRRQRIAGFVVLVLSVLFCAWLSDVDPRKLFDANGAQSAMDILSGFAQPDFSGDFLWRVARLSAESLFIGILATSIAVAAGFLLALVATKVPGLPDAPEGMSWLAPFRGVTRFIARSVLGVTRAIPAIIWAYIFVRAIGLGPGPAVLAIAVSTMGIVGKLYAELAEAVDPEMIHALQRSGCSRFSILLFGVLPSVWRQWLAYSLFRLECSIRSASILGVVGAGGLGAEIALSVQSFQYDKLATTLIAVLIFVVSIEVVSTMLRKRRLRWSVFFAASGSLLALKYLKIPWSEMTPGELVPNWLTRGGNQETAAFIKQALWYAGETLAMAWSATMVAGLIALLISPLASSAFSLRFHNKDARRNDGVLHFLSWLGFLGARLFLQIFRALPELTLALVFVLWVGPGPFAGFLAVAVHTVGVLGRLYTDVYDEVEPPPVVALESAGAGRLGVWLYGVFPQVKAKLLAFTLYRFEVNVRATAMIGFVGAGGLGDEIHTAIQLFHGQDLLVLLALMIALVLILDVVGDRIRHRILTAHFLSPHANRKRPKANR
jgi:phosphonate transport system permease protein